MLASEIKTASDLRVFVESHGHEPYFFTRNNMRFSGDSMRNYGVRRVTVKALYDSAGQYHPEGIERKAFELYRRKPVKHGLQSSAYFDAETFQQIHCIKD